MKRILVLDDDDEICELLQEFLTNEGFTVVTVRHPRDFLARFTEGFDLAIVDVRLPDMDGFEVLRQVRARSDLPVLMLTARGEANDRIAGLEAGADDYLPKPFEPRELVARMKAILRRLERGTFGPAGEILQVGDLRLLTANRQVFRGSEEITLTAVEYKLLEILLRSPGVVIKRQDLARQALERTLSYDDRSLDVHMSHLRKKLGSRSPAGERIQAVWGVGYVLSVPVENMP